MQDAIVPNIIVSRKRPQGSGHVGGGLWVSANTGRLVIERRRRARLGTSKAIDDWIGKYMHD